MQTLGMKTEGTAPHPGSLTPSMLPKLRAIMQLCDPRDCLTSAYYSFSKSHVLPKVFKKHHAFEDMVSRTDSWLKAIADYLEQPLDAALSAKLVSVADFSVAEKDANKHKRQVTQSDHPRKLKPETTTILRHVGPGHGATGILRVNPFLTARRKRQI